jgi:hypothetical protein
MAIKNCLSFNIENAINPNSALFQARPVKALPGST